MDAIKDEALRLARLVADTAGLPARSSDPGLWDDPAAAQVVLRRADELREEIGAWQELGALAVNAAAAHGSCFLLGQALHGF